MRVCRAEDGTVVEVPNLLEDVQQFGSVEGFLSQVADVPEESLLAYLPDGHRLRADNLLDLGAAPEQSVYVFNRNYLDEDLETVLPKLHLSVSSTAALLEAYSRTARTHLDWIVRTANTLRVQNEAVRIASSSLDMNVLAISEAFKDFSETAQHTLVEQDRLLRDIDTDLEIIARMKIHPEFLSPAVRKSIEAGERPRTLGDYVSNVKMRQVSESCANTNAELKGRFDDAQNALQTLSWGADNIRSSIMASQLHVDAEQSVRRAQELTQALDDDSNSPDLADRVQRHDQSLREEATRIAELKNKSTELCLNCLRQISVLNTQLVDLPPSLSVLQNDFRSKTSFSHIRRLHNMLYAYGATIIEIVRRKEFIRFFGQRAQVVAEMLAKLSAGERKRRQIYRSDVHGQLPFDARGLEDNVPSIEISTVSSSELPYSFERSDIESFFEEMGRIEHSIPSFSHHPMQATREALEKLVVRMDSLEANFDRMAERSLLSTSRVFRRPSVLDDPTFQETRNQLLEMQHMKAELEAQFEDHRHSLEDEIDRLRGELTDATTFGAQEHARAEELLAECERLRDDEDSHHLLQQRHEDLLEEHRSLQSTTQAALAESTRQAQEIESLRAELAQFRQESQEMKNMEEANAAKIAELLAEQQTTLGHLEQTRRRGEDLEAEIARARAEGQEVTKALREATKEKERILRLQASEHDRRMRDHIAEADGDRAVLEHQFSELRAALAAAEGNLKEARMETEVAHADLAGVREELQRTTHELSEERGVVASLSQDSNTARVLVSEAESRLEASERLKAEFLQVAIGLRQALAKAMTSAQAASSHTSKPSGNMSESILSNGNKGQLIPVEDFSAIDPSDPVAALEMLREFDLDTCAEVLAKPVAAVRRWQKQCKEYRERAKGKIAFRNFAKGDLALFLPTRNSLQKPWAAFNVSFPHYFLQASGHVAEQLKTREWIVARITSITERVVHSTDPSTNPYGLGDGVKYYMLQVEDWTQPSGRRGSSRKTSGDKTIMPSSSQAQPQGSNLVNSIDSLPSALAQPEYVEPSPTSRLFPSRSRTQSSPSRNGPSSLSKLLAQAPPPDSSPPSTSAVTQSKTTGVSEAGPSVAPLPVSPRPSLIQRDRAGSLTSLLRPASRASTSSTRFSSGKRMPPFPASGSPTATGKTLPTTAVSETHGATGSSGPSSTGTSISPVHREGSILHTAIEETPSPGDSAGESLSNIFKSISVPKERGRTTSITTMPSAALSSLTGSWTAAFSKKGRGGESDSKGKGKGRAEEATGITQAPSTPASELLRRFENSG
ncbi:hypothetical protein SISNIDRAFT_491213 [Sistotremastrum niveocremeum HHB9708]|uniref:Autophagy-related protein 11 n=1 Tax=Sistotremastrum niveocremeum HHB9708 TaxID=1314777 RepID=A0A164N136_9AGAM|nr:hypothetical protein SISNIDRAFT_491213 [Sistotremastrum niveocremeum HHB9708]